MGLPGLRDLRQKKGLTLEALAQKLGTSRGYISNLENDKKECSLRMAKNIAQIFKCKIDDLI
ncbi:MAG: helix-turn-helix transcriptional regulator [PVC group bacterium]|nr:helix-turn-helix transcriptional regulator [PVC group bacterium]